MTNVRQYPSEGAIEIMLSSPTIWTEQRTVESFEVDMNGKLKPHMLFAYLLNSAWKHTEGTDISYQKLATQNLMWVLSKMQLSFEKTAVWGDKILIETWAKGIERFYALRDFQLTSANGERLCSATAAWMILEKDSYRPQRLDQIMKTFPWNPGKSVMETKTKKVPAAVQPKPCKEYAVSYSDIDVNRHVTAARYLQWILDSHPIASVTKNELTNVDISFLAEAVLGDNVSVLMETDNGGDLYSICRTKDMKELCRARLEWKEVA